MAVKIVPTLQSFCEDYYDHNYYHTLNPSLTFIPSSAYHIFLIPITAISKQWPILTVSNSSFSPEPPLFRHLSPSCTENPLDKYTNDYQVTKYTNDYHVTKSDTLSSVLKEHISNTYCAARHTHLTLTITLWDNTVIISF